MSSDTHKAQTSSGINSHHDERIYSKKAKFKGDGYIPVEKDTVTLHSVERTTNGHCKQFRMHILFANGWFILSSPSA